MTVKSSEEPHLAAIGTVEFEFFSLVYNVPVTGCKRFPLNSSLLLYLPLYSLPLYSSLLSPSLLFSTLYSSLLSHSTLSLSPSLLSSSLVSTPLSSSLLLSTPLYSSLLSPSLSWIIKFLYKRDSISFGRTLSSFCRTILERIIILGCYFVTISFKSSGYWYH